MARVGLPRRLENDPRHRNIADMAYSVLDAAKARFPEYDLPQHNLLRRGGLDASLRARLPASRREDWPRHARYAEGAGNLLGIHKAMLHNAANTASALTALAEGRVAADQRRAVARQVHEAGRGILDHLHAHHHIEDQQLFPHFVRLRPAIAHPIRLLEGDHRVLNAVASQFDRALREYPAEDAQAAAYSRAAEAMAQLDRVMRRHIADEEEILIPAYLGL